MENSRKLLAAAEAALLDAFLASDNADTQAMVAWVTHSYWVGPDTSFIDSAVCCFEDAREGDLNGASREDVARWRALWDAARGN